MFLSDIRVVMQRGDVCVCYQNQTDHTISVSLAGYELDAP
jgi:hypothetical protein